MSHQSERDTMKARAARAVRGGIALAIAAACSVLAACSSGSGGTDVTIGSGQNQDPVTLDFPVFYVKRPVPAEDDDMVQEDARELRRFQIGADLFMRDRASVSSPEINITGSQTEGLGDIRDLDVNFDGSKVVFAMRAQFIEGADEEDQPTWNIWEFDAATDNLRRIITSDTVEDEGHDIMPHYLPDGRIVFSSTRQRQSRAIQLDENKPQYAGQDEDDNEPAFVLHVMDDDGTNIHQISFNQSHDLDPAVLPNGRIVFTRWEHEIDDNQFDLYSVNPDGSDMQLLYGAYSHATGTVDPETTEPSIIQFLSPRPMQDGRTLALVRPFEGTGEGGDLVLIDTQNFVDNTVPVSASSGMPGPAQVRALPTDVRTIEGPSPGGRYRAAAPLFDGSNRLLVSWSQCRLIEDTRFVPCTSDRLADPEAEEAPPLFGIYIYDVPRNTQQPVVVPQEGFMYTEVVAGSPRVVPPVILDRAAGVDFPQDLLAEAVGVLHIRSVYDIDGVDQAPGGISAVRDPANAAYATRPARFLRIEKAVAQPDDDIRDIDNTAFGPNRALGMRDILGYAPIEPDGSVKVKVPANVAFNISVLDARGRRLGGVLGSRHTNWLQVMPGEQLQCSGCHNPTSNPPRAHGRAGLTSSVNAGATTNGSAFPNTNAALFADAGETMAEVRNRVMCGGACEPSVDVAFQDYWPADSRHHAFGRRVLLGGPLDRAVRCGRSDATCHLYERAAGHDAAGRRELHLELDQPVPHHDPLRDAHPPDVGHRPLRRCERRHHTGPRSGHDAADQPQVQQLSRARQRSEHDGRAGGQPRPHRWPVRRRARPAPLVSRAVVRRRRPGRERHGPARRRVPGVRDRPGHERDDLRGVPRGDCVDECERCHVLEPLLRQDGRRTGRRADGSPRLYVTK